MHKNPNASRVLILALTLLMVGGCATAPPTVTHNLCTIFEEKEDWYDDARDAEKRWGVSIPVLMAFMHQESRFQAKAKPPRSKILWIIPGPRLSDAFGYPQAKDSTWEWYQEDTGNGWAERDDFDDAIDFIGWYNAMTHKRNGLSTTDAYSLYLAYHEGHGGYARGSYRGKPGLRKVAKRVSLRAQRYNNQLAGCREELEDSGWWPF